MKVTSLKDIEAYIYSSVLIPLKRWQINELYAPTPMTDHNGRNICFEVSREPVDGTFRHNYERTKASRSAPYIVTLEAEGMVRVVAKYHTKTHRVTVYTKPFHNIRGGMLILGKFQQSFLSHTPFTKVTLESEYQGNAREEL